MYFERQAGSSSKTTGNLSHPTVTDCILLREKQGIQTPPSRPPAIQSIGIFGIAPPNASMDGFCRVIFFGRLYVMDWPFSGVSSAVLVLLSDFSGLDKATYRLNRGQTGGIAKQ